MVDRTRYVECMMNECGYNVSTAGPFFAAFARRVGELYFADKSARIVDIGAGAGHWSVALREAGYSSITAVDCDQASIGELTRLGFRAVQVDLDSDDLPFAGGSVDVFWCFNVIEHLQNPAKMLSSVVRCMSPNGLLVLSTPDWLRAWKTFWDDPTHVRPFTRRSLSRLLLMHGLRPFVMSSYGLARGVGRLRLWKLFPSLMFTGTFIFCIAKKNLKE